MKRFKEIASRNVIFWSLALAVSGLFLLSTLTVSGQPAASAGEATYNAKCAGCHGPDGSGDTKMGKMMKVRDLRSAEVQKQTDAQLAEIIAKGKSPMPPTKSLDKAKIDEVVAYLRELGKKK